MTYEFIPFGGPEYFVYFALLLFARGMDMFSTWIATPNLESEANPIAKWLGWRGGALVNFAFCVIVAIWPLPSIITAVISLFVAARNFQAAWVMRTMGEGPYARHIQDQLRTTRPMLFMFCMGAQTICVGIVGFALIYFTPLASIGFAVGVGVVGYALLTLFFSLLSIWRIRRA